MAPGLLDIGSIWSVRGLYKSNIEKRGTVVAVVKFSHIKVLVLVVYIA